jgi:hypothetical protein
MLLEFSYKKIEILSDWKIFTVFTYILITGYMKVFYSAPRQQIQTNSQRKKSQNIRNR